MLLDYFAWLAVLHNLSLRGSFSGDYSSEVDNSDMGWFDFYYSSKRYELDVSVKSYAPPGRREELIKTLESRKKRERM